MPSLFSASVDKTVKQWDLETNSCIRTFEGDNSIRCLAATMDADRLLSGDSDGFVLLWDIASGEQLASVKAHPYIVSCLAVTPDGSSFVTGSWDSSLKLWRFDALQQPVIEFRGHSDSVYACVLSSDGSRLYSCGNESSILVWDITTGQQLETMQSHTDGVNSLALSGPLLVSGSDDETVKLWDTGGLQLLHTLQGHSSRVWNVAVISDSIQLVLSGCANGDLRVWDAASGAQLALLHAHSPFVYGIAVCSYGSLAASACFDQTICVWDLASFSLRATLRGHLDRVNAVLYL